MPLKMWHRLAHRVGRFVASADRRRGQVSQRLEHKNSDSPGDLVAVKNAWRNPTMHIEKRYDQDEATLILKSVEAFMRRMSTKLKS